MRPQLNVSLDEYPELPEKIRKLCKVRGYKISDFCARVLNAAIDKEIAEITGNTSELPSQANVEVIEELRARLDVFEESLKSSDLEETLNKLGQAYNLNVPRLIDDVWTLQQAVFDCAEPLIARVEKLEALFSELRADMEKLKKPEGRSEDGLTMPADSPQFQCPHCGAVGIIGRNFKNEGSSKDKRRYRCTSCDKKTINLIEVK